MDKVLPAKVGFSKGNFYYFLTLLKSRLEVENPSIKLLNCEYIAGINFDLNSSMTNIKVLKQDIKFSGLSTALMLKSMYEICFEENIRYIYIGESEVINNFFKEFYNLLIKYNESLKNIFMIEEVDNTKREIHIDKSSIFFVPESSFDIIRYTKDEEFTYTKTKVIFDAHIKNPEKLISFIKSYVIAEEYELIITLQENNNLDFLKKLAKKEIKTTEITYSQPKIVI
jgi:hypothetical protein